MFSKHKFHSFREKNHSVQQLVKNKWLGLNSWTFSAFQQRQNQYNQERNTTKQISFPNNIFQIKKEQIFHVGVGVGIWSQTRFITSVLIFLHWEHSGNLK